MSRRYWLIRLGRQDLYLSGMFVTTADGPVFEFGTRPAALLFESSASAHRTKAIAETALRHELVVVRVMRKAGDATLTQPAV